MNVVEIEENDIVMIPKSDDLLRCCDWICGCQFSITDDPEVCVKCPAFKNYKEVSYKEALEWWKRQ